LADIRGYSSFAAARGDEAAAALTGRFIALAGRVVGGFGGESVGNRGDEVLFAFASPRQAIRAAVAFERALLDATREDPSLPMPAGVGIDVGEAVVVADGWRANAINVAARLCSLARGGEILATREVVHLAQAIDGVGYSPCPATRVKGIAQPVNPVRVVSEGGDTARGFAQLGFTHAQAPPAPGRSGRRALAAGIAAAVIVAAAIVVALGSGGSAGARLAGDEVGAVDTGSGQVASALPVSSPPTSVAVGGDGSIWVASAAAGTLSRIDPKTHAVTQIPVGSDPVAVAVAPGGSVWVANSGDGTVSRVSPQDDRVVGQPIQVGAGPSALVATPSAVWVANTLNASVSKIDIAGDRVVAKIPVGSEPAGIAAGGGSIWVADQGDRTVYRLDPQTGAQVAAPVTVGNGPVGVAYGDGAAWVANSTDGTLMRIDPQSNSVTGTIPVGQGPYDVVAGRGRVWVSDEYGNAVAQVDPATLTVVHTTSTSSAPLGLALAGDRLWVATDSNGSAAHRGGVLNALASGLTFGVGSQDPATFDPGSAYTEQLWRVLIMTGDGLVGYRRAGGIEGSALVPDLATSLPVPTDNGLTYTFRIRSGIRYSDGVLLRASDFRAGLERAFKVGGGPVQYFASLIGGQQCLQHPPACNLSHGVVADDATSTVTFHLAAPDPDLLNQLALPAAYPVPPGTPVQLRGPTVPGTGPYEIVSYSPAPSQDPQRHGLLVLSRNPYFRQWSAAAQPDGFPEQIVIHTNYSPAEQVAAVKQGRADFAWDGPPPAALTGLAQSLPLQLHENVRGSNYLWLNVHLAPFDDVLARRAFNYAIDRNALASMGWTPPGGTQAVPGRRTCQLLPPDFPAYVAYCPYTLEPVSSGRWLAPDVATAQALVRQSGTLGDRVTVLQYTSLDRRVGQEIVSTLRAIGYRATLEDAPLSRYFGRQSERLYSSVQAGTLDWIADYVGPSDFLVPLIECGQIATNDGKFCDPSLDARIRKALADQSVQAGVALQEWTAIDRSVVNDAADVPISNSLEADLVARRVSDFQFNPQWGVLVDQLWVR
jgi:YVTN family beta-propeller protein